MGELPKGLSKRGGAYYVQFKGESGRWAKRSAGRSRFSEGTAVVLALREEAALVRSAGG